MAGFPILPGGCAGSKALGRSKRELVVKLYDEKQHTVGQICEMMRISKPTLILPLKTRMSTKLRIDTDHVWTPTEIARQLQIGRSTVYTRY